MSTAVSYLISFNCLYNNMSPGSILSLPWGKVDYRDPSCPYNVSHAFADYVYVDLVALVY